MKPVFDKDKDKDNDKNREIVNIHPTFAQDDEVVKRSESVVAMIPKEEAEKMVIQASENAVQKALASQKRETRETRGSRNEGDEEEYTGISSKMVKELQGIAGVFNALKEFSANPLQQAIEQKVGQVAAESINRVFSPPSPQSTDILDKLLNSQFAAGLGAGLGQRGPEMLEKATGLFGKEKVDGWIGGAMTGRGGGGSGIPGASMSGQQGGDVKQSEVDLILSLDPNNPEHIVAYAASQGGIPNDVARKMLMIHQDSFVKQGRGISGIGSSNSINIQEYRRPVAESSYSDEQNLNVEQQKIDNDLKSRQLEPDALITADTVNISATNPQMEPEILEMGQQVQEQRKTESVESKNVDSDSESVSDQLLRQLVEMVSNQNAVISQLQSDIDTIKTKKTNDKLDEEIFGGVRSTKNVKIGLRNDVNKEE